MVAYQGQPRLSLAPYHIRAIVSTPAQSARRSQRVGSASHPVIPPSSSRRVAGALLSNGAQS